jgi:hypothetical protein
VTVPRPGDGPGPMASGCYEPRQRRLRCWRLGGDWPSSPPGLRLGRGRECGGQTLILAPFLLEHSFWDCGFRPGGDRSSPPPGLGVGVGNFLRLWVRVTRESAARLEIVLQARLRVSARSHKHSLFLRVKMTNLKNKMTNRFSPSLSSWRVPDGCFRRGCVPHQVCISCILGRRGEERKVPGLAAEKRTISCSELHTRIDDGSGNIDTVMGIAKDADAIKGTERLFQERR